MANVNNGQRAANFTKMKHAITEQSLLSSLLETLISLPEANPEIVLKCILTTMKQSVAVAREKGSDFDFVPNQGSAIFDKDAFSPHGTSQQILLSPTHLGSASVVAAKTSMSAYKKKTPSGQKEEFVFP